MSGRDCFAPRFGQTHTFDAGPKPRHGREEGTRIFARHPAGLPFSIRVISEIRVKIREDLALSGRDCFAPRYGQTHTSAAGPGMAGQRQVSWSRTIGCREAAPVVAGRQPSVACNAKEGQPPVSAHTLAQASWRDAGHHLLASLQDAEFWGRLDPGRPLLRSTSCGALPGANIGAPSAQPVPGPHHMVARCLCQVEKHSRSRQTANPQIGLRPGNGGTSLTGFGRADTGSAGILQERGEISYNLVLLRAKNYQRVLSGK